MKITTFKAFEHPTLEDLESLLKDKLGDKYQYEVFRKSTNLAGKIMTGSYADSITVIKNAYHRRMVSVQTITNKAFENGKETTISFYGAKLAGWLAFLNKQTGFVGLLIIRLIYGDGDGFYEEVESVIKTNIKGKDETIDVGLGSLLKKKK